MGCDIHVYLEKQVDGKWVQTWAENDDEDCPVFSQRYYGIFGFLAGVRNYSAVTPIAEQRGLPDDLSENVQREWDDWASDGHSASWLHVSELLNFNYEYMMENRRYMQQTGPRSWDGGATCDPGEGEKMSYREFLGVRFFDDLKKVAASGAERIVFWFDN